MSVNPNHVTCAICERTFNRRSRLDAHIAKRAEIITCDKCPELFCYEYQLTQHKQTAHVTGGSGVQLQHDSTLDTPILPDSGHPQTTAYQEAINDNYTKICNRTINTTTKKTINKQLTPNFTYGDLKRLLMEIRRGESSAFKINIGFVLMLFDTVNEVYRYFYVSSNNLLFNRAFTISTNNDMTDFFNKIVSLDLTTT